MWTKIKIKTLINRPDKQIAKRKLKNIITRRIKCIVRRKSEKV